MGPGYQLPDWNSLASRGDDELPLLETALLIARDEYPDLNPAAYAEAPTGTTILLTGLMSKLGVYGFLRVLLPLFPEELRLVLTPLLALAVAMTGHAQTGVVRINGLSPA